MLIVLHTFVVGAAQIAAAVVEDLSGQVTAAFLHIAHALDLHPVSAHEVLRGDERGVGRGVGLRADQAR
ncbi:hypothetical protein ACVGOW_19555 [Pseudonocardia saturnea]